MNLPVVVVLLCSVSVSYSAWAPVYQKSRTNYSQWHIPVYVRDNRPQCNLSFVPTYGIHDCDVVLPDVRLIEENEQKNLLITCYGMYDALYELCARGVQVEHSDFAINAAASKMCPLEKSFLASIKHSNEYLTNWTAYSINEMLNESKCNELCLTNGSVNAMCSTILVAHGILKTRVGVTPTFKSEPDQDRTSSGKPASGSPKDDRRSLNLTSVDAANIEMSNAIKKALHGIMRRNSSKTTGTTKSPSPAQVNDIELTASPIVSHTKKSPVPPSRASLQNEEISDKRAHLTGWIWIPIISLIAALSAGTIAFKCYVNRSETCCPQLTHAPLSRDSSSMTLNSLPETRVLLKLDKTA